jgi:hypothetical protein
LFTNTGYHLLRSQSLSPTECDITPKVNETFWRFEAFDLDANYLLGTSVSIYNRTAVVGAPLAESVASVTSGAAYIYNFNKDNGKWEYTQKMTPTFGIGDAAGTSVSMGGNYVVVGIPLNDQFGGNSGAIYIYEREQGGDTFTSIGATYSPTPAVSALFGWSVAVNKNGVIVVGARADRTARGSVYVYKKTGNQVWTLADTLEPDVTQDPTNGGNFGWSVAIDELYVNIVWSMYLLIFWNEPNPFALLL